MITSLILLFFMQEGNFAIDERFRVEYVLLDVMVHDKKGEIVNNLSKDDFIVTENGKKMDVTSFKILDLRGSNLIERAEDQPEEIKARRPNQQIVIVLDLESAKLVDAEKAFAQTKSFIQALDSSLNFRINLYSMERGSLTEGFTGSKAELLSALDELIDRHRSNLPGQRERDYGDQPILRDHDNGNGSGILKSNGGGFGGMLLGNDNNLVDLENAFIQCRNLASGGRDNDAYQRCIYNTLSQFMEEMEIRTQRMIGELELLTYNFEDNEGLKLMMLISPGFPTESVSSAEELARIYVVGNSQRTSQSFLGGSSNLHVREEFQRVVHACVKNRVIFHTFDIFNGNIDARRMGVEFSDRPSTEIHSIYRRYMNEIADGLRELADQSGGTFSQLFNFEKALTTRIDNSKFFYVLGYNSPQGKPGKFRKIKVTSKKALALEYRKGYYGR